MFPHPRKPWPGWTPFPRNPPPGTPRKKHRWWHASREPPALCDNSSELFSVVQMAPRAFLREPAVVLTALAVLAVGIGCSTAIFTVLQKLVLEPLPFAQADR